MSERGRERERSTTTELLDAGALIRKSRDGPGALRVRTGQSRSEHRHLEFCFSFTATLEESTRILMELAASDKSCEDLAISHPEFLPPTYP